MATTVIPYSVNHRALWDEFVSQSKNGSFVHRRAFLDMVSAEQTDCSVMVFSDLSPEEAHGEAPLSVQKLVALLAATWDEPSLTVCSHPVPSCGALLLRPESTQQDGLLAMQAIFRYYISFMQARRMLYSPLPHIYSQLPADEDLYALFRAQARLCFRTVSTVLSVRQPLRSSSLRRQQARRAIDNGFYIDRLIEGDHDSVEAFCHLPALQAPTGSAQQLAQLIAAFPSHIKLYLVRLNRQIVAGALVFELRTVALVRHVAASPEGREGGALDLLFHHLTTERYRQMDYIDFGPSAPDGGLADDALVAHKESLGGRAVCRDTYEVTLTPDTADRMLPQPAADPTARIDYLPLQRITASYEPQLTQALERVARRGWFLLGEETEAFETEFARYTGASHCVAVGNGLDALTLALVAWRQIHAWQDDDEVIVPANTYIATILAISRARLRPVLCEPRPDTLLIDPDLIEPLITERTRALLPVHLYGRLCPMDEINHIARSHGLLVLDDAAQSHGAILGGRRAGHLCHATAFSFYPTKNLGALGDAGAVCTDDEQLAHTVRCLANYGSLRQYHNELKGVNSRMDELQAAVLRTKLPQLDARNEHRRHVAQLYRQLIHNPLVTLTSQPAEPLSDVHHVFPVRCPQRDALRQYLAERGVQTLVHYPTPPHRQPAYAEWSHLRFPITERIHSQILSLPIHSLLTDAEVERIAQLINAFNPA